MRTLGAVMKARSFLCCALTVLMFTATAGAQERSNILNGLLRGLGDALLQRQQGGTRQNTLPPPSGYGRDQGRAFAPRVFNVCDAQGNEGRIVHGQLFHVVGEGFGHREGQVAILPDNSDQWITLNPRSIQSWEDDDVVVIIPDAGLARATRVAVGIVTAEGRSDALPGVIYETMRGGTGPRPPGYGLPPIPTPRPQPYPPAPAPAPAPENTPWSVAAYEGPEDVSPRSNTANMTLTSLGNPVAAGNFGSNTRYWASSTIALLTMGIPSNPPWHHFVVGIAAGSANAPRIADTLARAGAQGQPLRLTQSYPPAGGYPSLVVSTERLGKAEQFMDALDERSDCALEERLMLQALRIEVPDVAGRLRSGRISEIGRSQCGQATSVCKMLSAEGKYVTVLVFLNRTREPYRDPRGATRWRNVRSLRLAVLGHGPMDHEQCCRMCR
jgi:hypothetical protein